VPTGTLNSFIDGAAWSMHAAQNSILFNRRTICRQFCTNKSGNDNVLVVDESESIAQTPCSCGNSGSSETDNENDRSSDKITELEALTTGDGSFLERWSSADDYYRNYEKIFTNNFSLPHSTSNTNSNPSRDDENPASSTASLETSLSDEHRLSHVDVVGKASMVDVSAKLDTRRVAVATARVRLPVDAFRLVAENRAKKGDVLGVAQLAGVIGAKRTSELIPLCHNVALTHVGVTLTLDTPSHSVVISCTASTTGKTGVEMEALTGVTIAALTVYDMCKSVSHKIVIEDVRLSSKSGGKSGEFKWEEQG